jgi:hypothetical protein
MLYSIVSELRTLDCGLWTVDSGLWTLDCGLWTWIVDSELSFGVFSMRFIRSSIPSRSSR